MKVKNNLFDHFQCFAWSPYDDTYHDMVAIGLSNGRAQLVRMTNSESVVGEFYPRNARSCNALSFNVCQSTTLAIGLDKIRGDCGLLIWDCEYQISSPVASPAQSNVTASNASTSRYQNQSLNSRADPSAAEFVNQQILDGTLPLSDNQYPHHSNTPPPFPSSLPSGASTLTSLHPPVSSPPQSSSLFQRKLSTESSLSPSNNPSPPDGNNRARKLSTGAPVVKPLLQYGLSESIQSLSWLTSTAAPTLLAAGMSMKWLRIFDTRVDYSQVSSTTISTKAVLGLQHDPLMPSRFASFNDEGLSLSTNASSLLHPSCYTLHEFGCP